mmetsp:Transcript_17162/g.43148  ORF Transcript_17162/g.43148 Transcript_17162/m.43148 type:complete len:354 (-) Transcript_17162:176-1237(-)
MPRRGRAAAQAAPHAGRRCSWRFQRHGTHVCALHVTALPARQRLAGPLSPARAAAACLPSPRSACGPHAQRLVDADPTPRSRRRHGVGFVHASLHRGGRAHRRRSPSGRNVSQSPSARRLRRRHARVSRRARQRHTGGRAALGRERNDWRLERQQGDVPAAARPGDGPSPEARAGCGRLDRVASAPVSRPDRPEGWRARRVARPAGGDLGAVPRGVDGPCAARGPPTDRGSHEPVAGGGRRVTRSCATLVRWTSVIDRSLQHCRSLARGRALPPRACLGLLSPGPALDAHRGVEERGTTAPRGCAFGRLSLWNEKGDRNGDRKGRANVLCGNGSGVVASGMVKAESFRRRTES